MSSGESDGLIVSGTQVLSNEPVTHALDLWALGCIIYQMLVGKAPFKAASEYLTFQLIADASYSFPANPALPPTAEDIIRKLLVVDSGARVGGPHLPHSPPLLHCVPLASRMQYSKPSLGFTQ